MSLSLEWGVILDKMTGVYLLFGRVYFATIIGRRNEPINQLSMALMECECNRIEHIISSQ